MIINSADENKSPDHFNDVHVFLYPDAHIRSYEARWLNKTNLVFIVWDATCDCSVFEDSSEEPEHEDSSSTNSKDGVSQTATTTTTPSDSGSKYGSKHDFRHVIAPKVEDYIL